MKIPGKKIKLTAASAISGAVLFIFLCIILKTPPGRLIGAAFCHQIPARSPSPDFPFCFRCAGLFSGIVWSILFSLLSENRREILEKKAIAAFSAAVLLFVLDILNTSEYIPVHWYEENTGIRFLSSFPLGFMLVRLITAVWFYFFDSFRPRGLFPLSACLPVLLFTAGVSFLIIFRGSPFILQGFGYFIAAGSLFFLLLLYSILIKCIAYLKNRSYPDRAVIHTALLLVLLQICLLGGLHIRFLPSEVFERIQ